MSYGAGVLDVTQAYQDDPELRRRIEAMRMAQSRLDSSSQQDPAARLTALAKQYQQNYAKPAMTPEQASYALRGDSVTAAPDANPVDRLRNAVTDSDYVRSLSPEAQRVIGGGMNIAEALPPVAVARGSYDVGSGLAESDYGKAALGALNAIPDAGRVAGVAAAAAVPLATKEGRQLARTLAADERGGLATRMANASQNAVTPEALTDLRVGTRVPSLKNTPIDPARDDVRINLQAMRDDPEYFGKVSGTDLLNDRKGDPQFWVRKDKEGNIIAQERAYGPLRPLLTEKQMTSADPEERMAAGKGFVVSNLGRLYKAQEPLIRQRSEMWYPGGNALLMELAQRYGVSDPAAAGAVAALSPQKDWFQNFDLARRMMESHAEDPVLTEAMLKSFRPQASSGLKKYADDLKDKVGMRLSQMNDADAGKAAVIHDIVTRGREYPRLAPEGFQMGWDLTSKGVPAKIAWGSGSQVENAMTAIRSGGDISKISPALGDRHKVRNFYNNLIAPDRRFDDYTSDTHNIAASLLRPLAGADWDVEIGLGGMGPKSGATGAKGLYGLYADAGRELAAKYGVAPYEIQSPTWEGVRSLFPDTFKTGENKAKIDKVWDAYRKGDISQEKAQNLIFEMTPHGPSSPPWRTK